jgi:hypothetical protein
MRAPKKKPMLGTMRGKIRIIDPDWWKPMTDAEVDEFLFGDQKDSAPEENPKKKTKRANPRKK